MFFFAVNIKHSEHQIGTKQQSPRVYLGHVTERTERQMLIAIPPQKARLCCFEGNLFKVNFYRFYHGIHHH